MSSFRTARQAVKGLGITILLLSVVLISIGANSAYSNDVSVSPGKSDLRLGDSFPTFGSVKLRYPNSSILTNSIGDLLFTVTSETNITQAWCDPLNLTLGNCRLTVDIYIPPDFSNLATSNLWTSFTNNYDPHSISLSRQSSSDQFGPNWWKVTVSNLNFTSDPTNPLLVNPANRVFLVTPNTATTYISKPQYVRLFQVTSPTTAGRYFFKAFFNGISIGARYFPTLVVKASRDPAYISGVLRELGDRDPTKAGQNITLSNNTGAQVVASGIDYLGQPVSAQAFINSTAKGQYTLFGVAPGTYNITAYAAGYIPTTRPGTVSVAAAQSLEGVDISLPRSVNLTLSVLSMTADGFAIPWGTLSGISPNGTTSTGPRSISFQLISVSGTSTIDTTSQPLSESSSQFTLPSFPPTDLDGRIPQDKAADTSGLVSGDYYVRAYVLSYVQLDDVLIHVSNQTTHIRSEIRLLRSNSLSVTVHFKDRNSALNETKLADNGTLSVQLYDQQGILRGQNTTFVYAGNYSATLEVVGLSRGRTFGTVNQFSHDYGLLPGTYYVLATLKSSPLFSGFANIGVRNLYYQLEDVQVTLGLASSLSIRNSTQISFAMIRGGGLNLTLYSVDAENPSVLRPFTFPNSTITFNIIDPLGNVYYANATQPNNNATVRFFYAGLLTNDYTILVNTLGYTQRALVKVHVVLGGNSDISLRLLQDPVIDLTLVFKTEGLLSFINSTQPYAQPINHLDGTPARIEVFDERGNFVAANVSYIPNLGPDGPTRIAHFTLAGFDRYYGDPRYVWSGFYDTTDAASQNQGGLILYPWDNLPREYTIRVWVDGYYQFNQLQVTVPASDNASVIGSVDRASRISGTVIGPDFYDQARPLSWATISLEPNNYPLTGIIDVRPGNYTTSSLDGWFQLWVPQGSYGMGVSLAGYASYSAQIVVPSGSDINMWIWLDDYQSSSLAVAHEAVMMLPSASQTTTGTFPSLDRRLLRNT